MMVYSVINASEETIQNVAFKFVSEKDFLTAMVRSVEGQTRGFVAGMKQAEILGLRGEIVAVKPVMTPGATLMLTPRKMSISAT